MLVVANEMRVEGLYGLLEEKLYREKVPRSH